MSGHGSNIQWPAQVPDPNFASDSSSHSSVVIPQRSQNYAGLWYMVRHISTIVDLLLICQFNTFKFDPLRTSV